MDQREKYLKLKEMEKGTIYHDWVKRHGFIRFTEWEARVLDGALRIDFRRFEKERG